MISSGYGVFGRVLKRVSSSAVATVFLFQNAYAEPVTILALGDSVTAGYGLPQGQGFVPQLDAWLNDNGLEATVLNGGVSGDTTSGGAARLEWSLTDDVDAVLVALGGNDMLRGIAPETSRASLDQILSILSDRGLKSLLIGYPGPANFGPSYQAAFEDTFTDLAQKHNVALYPNIFAAIAEGQSMANTSRHYLQNDGLHPNREGVGLMVEAIGPVVLELFE